MSSDTVVNCKYLSYTYRLPGIRRSADKRSSQHALENVSLELNAGQVTALLGPNGAGKTTLIKLLLGLLPLQQGTISVLGNAPGRPQARQQTGVMLQASGVQENLSVHELLRLFSSLYRQPLVIDDLLQRLDLTAIADQRYQHLSGGQKQRVLFAIAMCGNPQLLILDEPSTGMDPASRRQFWDVIRDCRDEGRAILLCTHYMDEAEQLADSIVVLNQGQVLMHASADRIRELVPNRLIKLRSRLSQALLTALPGVQSVSQQQAHWHIYCQRAEQVLPALLRADPELSDLEVRRTDLETAFLALTQDKLEQAA